MTKPKILIVENEKIIAEDLHRTLRGFGYKVLGSISSGEDALKETAEKKPDLVLMDIKLKGRIDGIGAAEKIRTQFNIPVIYITALGDRATIKKAKITKPFGYIHKPVEEKELLSNIEIALYRHKLEKELKESEEKFRTLFELSPYSTVYSDLKGNILDCNRRFVKMHATKGGAKAQTGRNVSEFFPKSNWPLLFSTIKKTIDQGKELGTVEFTMLRDNGEEFPAETNCTLVRDHNGKPKALIAKANDITERKQAEKVLRKSQEFNEALFKYNPIETIVVDKKGRIIDFNFAKKKSAERTPNIGDVMYMDYAGKHEIDMFKELMKCINFDKKKSFAELKYINKFLSITIAPFPSGAIIISQDITERIVAEKEREEFREQLIQSEKMAGIGALASGVAHEFNNLLQILSGHVQYAKKTKKSKDIDEALDIVLNASDRASRIIRDLLIFSREEIEEKELCHINEPLESVLSMIEDQLKKQNMKIVRKYEETSRVKVNKGEIQQVFLNIITNSRDAMLPKGGKLEIEVRQNKRNVEVSFRDTGKGIAKENLKKVFEPFFTTKGATGKSSELLDTGLGLSVSYGIVSRHEGLIDVKSNIGKGTKFTVILPAKKGSISKATKNKGKGEL